MTFRECLLISIPFYSPLSKLAEHIPEQHRQYRASQYLKWEDESGGTAFPFYSKRGMDVKRLDAAPHVLLLLCWQQFPRTHTEQ